jgi:predicted RNA-binding protein with PIN domain
MSMLLVVDGANVVGSRPDGWWKDRSGAAARLHGRLLVADLPYDEVVLVLEGAAKQGVPEGIDHDVRTVHARRDGDSAIVSITDNAVRDGEQVTVITADRVLRGAVENLGARAMSPSWLLDHL